MPEVITKYPEVTLKVLQGNGAQCGVGARQRILTRCPRERFCSLRTGELCVYGLKDIPRMTQITVRELAAIVCPPSTPRSLSSFVGLDLMALFIAFTVGVVLGRLMRKRVSRSPEA